MIDPELVRKKYQLWVKWGVIAIAAAVTAPFAFLVLEGLLAWGFAALTFAIIANFAPAVGTWLANKKVQALVAVIEANPIETMKNLHIEKQDELLSAEGNIRDFEQELLNFGDQVKDLKNKYPEEAASYIEIQDKMKEALGAMRSEHQIATKQLDAFAGKIEKAEALFNMAKAANRMLEKSKSAQAEYFQVLKEQVSFNKVRTDLNRAFANLNTAVERRKNAALMSATTQPALPPAVEVVDITPQSKVRAFISRN